VAEFSFHVGEAPLQFCLLALLPHPRPLRWDDDGFHAAFKITHRHLGRRVLELEIFPSVDRALPVAEYRPLQAMGPASWSGT
jgi:hypothetical protein